jgi:hypothetical protein
MLKFGREGLLDLNSPYYLKTIQGLQVIPPESWSVGFGMQCRMPLITEAATEILTFIQRN